MSSTEQSERDKTRHALFNTTNHPFRKENLQVQPLPPNLNHCKIKLPSDKIQYASTEFHDLTTNLPSKFKPSCKRHFKKRTKEKNNSEQFRLPESTSELLKWINKDHGTPDSGSDDSEEHKSKSNKTKTTFQMTNGFSEIEKMHYPVQAAKSPRARNYTLKTKSSHTSVQTEYRGTTDIGLQTEIKKVSKLDSILHSIKDKKFTQNLRKIWKLKFIPWLNNVITYVRNNPVTICTLGFSILNAVAGFGTVVPKCNLCGYRPFLEISFF